MVDGRLGEWARERARIAPNPGHLPGATAEWIKSQGYPLPYLDDQIRRMVKEGELAGRIAAPSSARSRLEAAYRRRAAAAVASHGGESALNLAIREAASLAQTGVVEARAEMVRELAAELAAIDARLARLGVSPDGPAPEGLAARKLVADRGELAGPIAALRAGAASKEAADAGSILAAASDFSLTAYAEVLTRARAVPEAFPSGFEASWASIPLDSVVEAGPVDIVSPFEAEPSPRRSVAGG